MLNASPTPVLQPAEACGRATRLPQEVLRRVDMPGPRYTSYPTADRFSADFGPAQAEAAWRARAGDSAPLSVYVHVPFCESICYYCACNKVVTRDHTRAAAYVDALALEIGLVRAALGRPVPVSQLHLGGGTPTFLSDPELARLMGALRQGFSLQDNAEVSIEIDPRTVDAARLAVIRGLGFNRVSLGVQDFDAEVQEAIHRVQPFEAVRAVMEASRAEGFESVNADLIYGLPRQTRASFQRTVAQLLSLRPERIALYAYAHLPERFKPQRRIAVSELPDASLRLEMLDDAVGAFLQAGYEHIGMDHFALPDDALARARRDGRLQRNFQGYSTQADCDLIGLGVSAIGRVGATYLQNTKTLEDYLAPLLAGRLPAARGLTLNADDLLRRDVIMALMCHGRVDIPAVEARHGVAFSTVFADDIGRLGPLVDAGWVRLGGGAVEVTPAGRYVVRAAAMAFDRYLHHVAPSGAQFSRVV